MAVLMTACARHESTTIAKTDIDKDAVDALRAIEARAGGRLGAYILDPARGSGVGWRENERFAHCSSFKMSLAAMVLAGAERGEIDLDEVLRWSAQDLLSHSPVTSGAVDGGLPVKALAHATLVTSDNTAANVLLRRFGGPVQLTHFWRSLGDTVSRLDRYEPELNQIPAGSEFDTTTPAAMAATVARLLLGDRLSPQGRGTLKSWMIEVETGSDRLRSGFPADWISGDKTGTGISKGQQTYVDLAFGGPAKATPLIVACYLQTARDTKGMDPLALAAMAEVGRLSAAGLGTTPRDALRTSSRQLL
ncbi:MULTISPECIES: class A beta-lactamase [unclassified Novosphingobium]|uniref:class A beta-lactamase n=1 Tax=unclassified Novosphingobium TaxID=2644732 RepID=UPI00135B1F68|nr:MULTISPECIES: class A beta-lactamase [unclassified Novosphingobium]